MIQKNSMTVRSWIMYLEKTLDPSNISSEELLEGISQNPNIRSLYSLIVPLYLRNLPWKTSIQLLSAYLKSIQNRERVSRWTALSVGEIGFEIILKNKKRLFDPRLFKADSSPSDQCFYTTEEIEQAFSTDGQVFVVASTFDEETGQKDADYCGVLTKDEVEDIFYVLIANPCGSLDQSLTASEASTLWGLERSVVRKAIERGRFQSGEYRKSGGTWLVTYYGMQRAFGAVPGYRKLMEFRKPLDECLWDEITRHHELSIRHP